MANNIIRRVWNQNRMVNIEDLTGAAFQAESGGHTFEISGIDDTGAAVALSGTVAGVFRRPDNADIALTGAASDGVVSVTLSEDCYAVPGRFGLTIFVTSNSQKVAVYACVGTVAVSSTGNVAGDTPQDVVDLINAIDAAVATIPADYTDLMAAIAPAYSSSALYAVGSYAWYDGSLYRCATPITTAETWTAAHWTAAVLGDDVSDLKSALYSIEDFSWSSGFINVYGNIDSASDPSRQHTEYLICPENTNITYVAETNHASVLGISFYDVNKTFISGVANNGTMGTAQTVTSPAGTRYCRLSTKAEILYSSYYAPAVRTLDGVTILAYANKTDLANRTDGYIAFSTNGSTRGAAVSVSGLLYARVIDNSYDISLQYKSAGGSDTNTDWVKYVDLSNYKQPFGIKIRKTDNSAMPVASANQAVVGTYMAWLATNGYVYKATGTAYVDGTDGSDDNNGLNATTAFKTIQKAISAGFKNILVREGTYTSGVDLYYANGVRIAINKKSSTFDVSTANTNPKVVIDCDGSLQYGVKMQYCSNCVLEDIEVKNATVDGFNVQYCEELEFKNCVVHDCAGGNGYTIVHTNADFVNCGCYNIGTMGGGAHHDGFNIHGTGTTNFINCWANYCEDDGISHHDACYGYVDGGEWHHCGKGAVCTPTHGACVDVRNVYAHDSAYGIYAGNDAASLAKTFTITNCVCLNNTTKDIRVANNTANIWNCIYSTIDHDGVGENNILTAN